MHNIAISLSAIHTYSSDSLFVWHTTSEKPICVIGYAINVATDENIWSNLANIAHICQIQSVCTLFLPRWHPSIVTSPLFLQLFPSIAHIIGTFGLTKSQSACCFVFINYKNHCINIMTSLLYFVCSVLIYIIFKITEFTNNFWEKPSLQIFFDKYLSFSCRLMLWCYSCAGICLILIQSEVSCSACMLTHFSLNFPFF
jgi:hypothetical protein